MAVGIFLATSKVLVSLEKKSIFCGKNLPTLGCFEAVIEKVLLCLFPCSKDYSIYIDS
jgi:hypothetical protein